MIFTIFPENFYEKMGWKYGITSETTITESRVRRRFRESRVRRRRPATSSVRIAGRSASGQLAGNLAISSETTMCVHVRLMWNIVCRPLLARCWLLASMLATPTWRFPESSSHSRFPFPAENRFFYRKTGNFHRKNDQEKISKIFVHVAPENTGKNQVSEKSCSKNSF